MCALHRPGHVCLNSTWRCYTRPCILLHACSTSSPLYAVKSTVMTLWTVPVTNFWACHDCSTLTAIVSVSVSIKLHYQTSSLPPPSVGTAGHTHTATIRCRQLVSASLWCLQSRYITTSPLGICAALQDIDFAVEQSNIKSPDQLSSDLAETEAGTNVAKDLQDSSLAEGAAGLLAMTTSTADRLRDAQVTLPRLPSHRITSPLHYMHYMQLKPV